eukprot:TRINITY_DN366_c0_g1_i1.p1 TRINITY_DN366_c0_g1~~TRINITY_DN366_c0_g1_i1.p1  ORF type:complete len:197 (+),score=44.23 TRINITY_DN366_c0_g1_i1:32-592(+)
MTPLALLASALAVTAAQNISPETNNEITNEELKNLNKPTGLDLKTAFRCGLFFPDPKDATKLPIAPLLIFNATWAAEECPDAKTEKHNQFCDSIFLSFSNKLTLLSPSLIQSRKAKGASIGDDVCSHLKKKVKAPFVGPKSKKFPKGLEFGMYSNACGAKDWTATGLRHGEKVCCKNGKYLVCPEE